MALCSVSDVEQFLQIDLNSTVEASVTNTFIPYVDAAIKRYLGHDVEQATYTETFDGNEQQDIFLRHVPIASITSVTEDGNTLTQGNENDYVYYDNGRSEEPRLNSSHITISYAVFCLKKKKKKKNHKDIKKKKKKEKKRRNT